MLALNNPSSNRLCSESELQLFPQKTAKELGLTEFSKNDYTYWNRFDPPVASILSDIAKEVSEGAKYYFIKPTSPFVVKKLEDKRYEWLSVDAVNGLQVEFVGKHVTNKNDQSFYINTGGHGGDQGGSVVDVPSMGLGGGGKFSLEDLINFLKTDNVALNIVQPGQDVRYPSKANHYIIAWCYSYRTAQRASQIAKDLKDIGYVPNEFRCDLTGRVMQVPTRFQGCPHVFDKEEIETYMNKGADKCPVKTGFFSTCQKVIDINVMYFDTSKKHKIKMFLDRTQEFEEAKNDNLSKTQKIDLLTQENKQLESEKKQLKGRVIDLTNEKAILENEKKVIENKLEQEKQEKNLSLLKGQRLETALEKLQIGEPKQEEYRLIDSSDYEAIRKIVIEMPILENYPNEWWFRSMRMEKSCVENLFLSEFFHGGIIARSNAFVSKEFNEFGQLQHREIITAFLEKKMKKILSKLSQEWVSFNKYEKEKWNDFALNFAEELMYRGFVLKRFNAITKENNVSIKYKKPETWNEVEPERWLGKTYEESVCNLLCQVTRFEVADHIIHVVKDLPNTEKQKEVARKREEELQEYWRKNPDVGYQSSWDGSGLSCSGMK